MEQAALKKRPLPSWFLDEPYMDRADLFYMEAFWDLHTTRSLGMSVGPIPWQFIIEYADRFGLEADLIEPFIKIIRAMDVGYLDWVSKEQERDKET